MTADIKFIGLIVTSDELEAFKRYLNTKDEWMRRLEEFTVDQVAAGEQQPETEHDFKGSSTQTGQENGRFWRISSEYIQYTLKNKEQEGKILRLTYLNGNISHTFHIYINGKLFQSENLADDGEEPIIRDYDLSGINSEILEVKIKSIGGASTPKLHHIRLMRSKI